MQSKTVEREVYERKVRNEWTFWILEARIKHTMNVGNMSRRIGQHLSAREPKEALEGSHRAYNATQCPSRSPYLSTL